MAIYRINEIVMATLVKPVPTSIMRKIGNKLENPANKTTLTSKRLCMLLLNVLDCGSKIFVSFKSAAGWYALLYNRL